jgi:hypothetical protein
LAKASFVLLPGLDGTATLFHRFIDAASAGVDLHPVRLPAEPFTYDRLADRIANQVAGPHLLLQANPKGAWDGSTNLLDQKG